jgi:hypothetical protein
MEGFKPSRDDLTVLTSLTVSVTRFKEIARTDFDKALMMFGSEEARHRLWAIDQLLWEPEQSEVAWLFFFSSAVHVVSGQTGRFPLVGFYNPFSDIFLITVWTPAQWGGHTMVDVEMLMGDWVRDDNDRLDPAPLWLRSAMHRPAALGVSVAESLLAFERVFATATPDNWRRQLAILRNEPALSGINYPGVALMLTNHLLTLSMFIDPGTQIKVFSACRQRTIETVAQAVEGKIATLLAGAENTLPATRQSLTDANPQWFKGLKVAGVVTDSEGCLVFLSPVEVITGSLALFFSHLQDRCTLQRIDYIDYQNFYNQFKFATHASGQGGGR